MRVLVTRPAEDAAATAARLEALGHEALIEPLLDIRLRAAEPPDLAGVQAILFTSANGVRAFAAASPRRDLAAFAVGGATAAAARAAGFASVESAEGDAADLAKLVRARLRPSAGALLHAAGAVVKGTLAAPLGEAGFEVRRVVLYDAQPAGALSPETTRALAEGRIAAVLLFSPRTAETFVSLVRGAGLEGAARGALGLCLSPAVAEAAGSLPWRELRVAERPDQEMLLALLGPAPGAGGGETRDQTMAQPPESAEEPTSAGRPLAAPPVEGGLLGAAPSAGQRAILLGIGALTLSVVVAGAAWLFWFGGAPTPVVAPSPSAPVVAAPSAEGERLWREMAGVLARLSAVETEQQAIRRRMEAERAAAGVDREARAGIDRLDQRLAAVEARKPEPAAAGGEWPAVVEKQKAELLVELGRLGKRLEALEERTARAAERAGHETALVLALSQLRQAIARGDPYKGRLDAALALAGERAEIGDRLGPLAEGAGRGIATLDALRARFEAPAREAVRAGLKGEGPGKGLVDAALDRLASVVTVRRVGEVPGEGAEAIVARAEARLAQRDLTAAVAEVERLSGSAGGAFAGWLAEARRRLAAERALDEAEAALVAARR
ncbi:MAG: uroporphyrinogen-III synthase [Proteobacteria bacterium]|nr:uroporphyrinogen-III synthase [Pseudomonadota bacterium]